MSSSKREEEYWHSKKQQEEVRRYQGKDNKCVILPARGMETTNHLYSKAKIARVGERLGYKAKTEVQGSNSTGSWSGDVLISNGIDKVIFEIQFTKISISKIYERQMKIRESFFDRATICWLLSEIPEPNIYKSDLYVYEIKPRLDDTEFLEGFDVTINYGKTKVDVELFTEMFLGIFL